MIWNRKISIRTSINGDIENNTGPYEEIENPIAAAETGQISSYSELHHHNTFGYDDTDSDEDHDCVGAISIPYDNGIYSDSNATFNSFFNPNSLALEHHHESHPVYDPHLYLGC